MAQEELVFAFHDGIAFTFERAPKRTASAFGGPMADEVFGVACGPKPLHLIARLGCRHILALSRHYLSSVPLIYGMCYDACEMKYRIHSDSKIELLELKPAQSSDDWPYRDYPPLLPYLPLQLRKQRRSSYDEFAAAFPNMPEKQSADLTVAVPPPATLGMSLWGGGDGDGVTIVFECDFENRTVRSTNVTS